MPPIALILAAALALLAGIVMFFAQVEDRTAAAAARRAIRLALDDQRQALAKEAHGLAWSNEAVVHLTGPTDMAWARDIIGPYQTMTQGLTASFVIDGADKTVLAFIRGRLVEAGAFDSLAGGLVELVRQSRASPLAGPIPASGLLALGGEPQIVAASAITPQDPAPPWPAGSPRYVLVLAQPLDAARLDRIGAQFQLQNLHLLAAGERAAETTIPLISPTGETLATLTWSPETPSLRLILGIEPVIAGVAAVIIALFWWFLRRAQRLSDTLSQQAAIIDQIHDAVIAVDRRGAITRWNAGAERMLGYRSAEMLGEDSSRFDAEGRFKELAERVLLAGEREQHVEAEILARRKTGEILPVHLSLSRLLDGPGGVAGVVGYILDITERKKLEARLEQLAIVDELTGAYNRRHLLAEAPAEIQRARRFHRPLSFLFMDLDHFKMINDRFGHPLGDRVLATFADVCRRGLRPSDLLVRYGGEEFMVMLPETGLQQAELVARRLADSVRKTLFSVEPAIEGMTVSIGVTALRDADDGLEGVLARVDKAAYQAKELGRDRTEVMA